MDDQRRRLKLGAVMVVASALVGWLVWGREGITAVVTFGIVAITIQMVAARIMHRLGVPATPDRLRIYAIGMGLRIVGVVAIGAAATLDRTTFPPAAAALGYLGTLLPLMWLETQLA